MQRASRSCRCCSKKKKRQAARSSSDVTSTNSPQYGQLFRLKASYQIPANYNVQSKAILTAMKEYGMYIADGGSDMYITGTMDLRWNNGALNPAFGALKASDFEVVMLGWR